MRFITTSLTSPSPNCLPPSDPSIRPSKRHISLHRPQKCSTQARDKVVYIGHPTKPTVYYTVADFHRVTFEHKFSEAIDLLIHLGAKEVRVERVRGWSREFSASLSVPLNHIDGTANIDAGAKQQSETHLLFEAKLPGDVKPRVPDGLWWYPHEPTWQSIANGRLRFGLQNFSLTVSYDDDFGVNAGLKVSAQKVGLDVGGNFEDHMATTWKIVGEFGTPVQDRS